MTGATVRAAGKLLFGSAWRNAFCLKFAIGDASLRRMCKDDRIVPPGLARDIETALRDKAHDIDQLLEGLIYD